MTTIALFLASTMLRFSIMNGFSSVPSPTNLYFLKSSSESISYILTLSLVITMGTITVTDRKPKAIITATTLFASNFTLIQVLRDLGTLKT